MRELMVFLLIFCFSSIMAYAHINPGKTPCPDPQCCTHAGYICRMENQWCQTYTRVPCMLQIDWHVNVTTSLMCTACNIASGDIICLSYDGQCWDCKELQDHHLANEVNAAFYCDDVYEVIQED